MELVLLHNPSTAHPGGTAQWLAPRTLRAHHHVRQGNNEDISRLVRRLTGHTIGVVMSGGGAKGYGHIGALRALKEAGIPVDEIGGTSMGALVSAGFAFGFDDVAWVDLLKEIGSRRALLDSTLPVVSFYETRKITEIIRNLVGETEIEDLWLPYFCVSCNLSKGEQMVHTNGPLWRAVRASMAAAPIFAPILDDGNLLVDGGFLNNFPVDVMRRRIGDATVLGIHCSPIGGKKDRSYKFGPSISGWDALRGQFMPSKRQHLPPNILGLAPQILDMLSLSHLQNVWDAADFIIKLPNQDYGMLDFDDYPALIEIGYQATREQLAAWRPDWHPAQTSAAWSPPVSRSAWPAA